MPLVVLTRHSTITDEDLEPLLEEIREIVAEQLTVPGTDGELKASEVMVRVQESSPLDQNDLYLDIMVLANVYPERLENLDERREWMAIRIKKLLPRESMSGSLWVLLLPGSYEDW